ncbi:MAG: hypothetical protein ACSHYF_11805 [Verrucomicrobiaceae bacterium]
MKTLILLTALICGGITTASAFTVDFSQHLGATTRYIGPGLAPPGSPVPPATITPIIVNVPGYGDIEFQVEFSNDLGPKVSVENYHATVTQEFTNQSPDPINALAFSHQTKVSMSFKGSTPVDIDFDFVGVGLGEEFDLVKVDDHNGTIEFSSIAGLIDPTKGEGNQAGLRSVSFNAVPEPTSALFGSLALLGLLSRRR